MGYTLSNIINEYLIEQGEGQTNKFARYYQFGVSGLRELNMDLSGVPKVTELTVNDNDTANLPNDYLNYTRIALCGPDGKLHSLGRNEDLCLNKSYNDCGEPTLPTESANTLSSYGWWEYGYWGDHFRNGELMGRFFGIGGGNNVNGYYRIDTRSQQIKFGNLCATTPSIVLEYLADVNSIEGDFEVHPFIIQTLKSWIKYQTLLNSVNSPQSAIIMAQRIYDREERLSRIRFNSRTSSEWLEAFRHGNQAAVKW